MRELDHLKVELSGGNLIEASAGTGKTYAIACLYLRLLIEKGLTPEQILVVTFTEAATEELRGRIRGRISEALDVFSGGDTKDRFLEGLRDNANEAGPGKEISIDLLDRALKSFDTASISTIHGFCLRALQDNAFESGSMYGTELVSDPSLVFQEAVDDFWRINFFGDQAPLLDAALTRGYSSASFSGFVKKMLDNPKMKLLPDLSSSDSTLRDRECLEAFEEVRKKWQECRKEIVEILENDKGLGRAANTYRNDLLPALFEAMDSFMGVDNPCNLFEGFDKFCTSGITKGKKPKSAAPEHPFFDTCEALKNKVDERFLFLKWELLEFCREHIAARKREANIRFFSDLLNDLYCALNGATGDALAACLRGNYRAGLIDEFQDTDPVQYDIFSKIFAGTDAPLFLIGDPKQAIYSFRGADIFAYLEASSRVDKDRRFTLTSNWRSTPLLLAAFNTVFDNTGNPFVYDEIAYHPISSGDSDSKCTLTLDRADGAPLQVWTIPPDENGEALSVGKANKAVQESVAVEIAKLLRDGKEGTARIKMREKERIVERGVVPGDIAVIVRSHRQAGLIQDELRELGIPSVMRSDETIFATGEAGEICTLLAGIADPSREQKVRAALATKIVGVSGDDIAALLDDEKAWEECLEKFRAYHQLWQDRGFMVMSQTMMAREGIRGRLLRRPDGERRLTNVLHCFEVIHQASHEAGLGIEGLLTWFGEKVATGEKSEEYQIRLETDEKAVKIVTVHVSKGLEYPVVFCPYLWGGIKTDTDVVTFHDKYAMVKDFGSDDIERHRALGDKEILAESLRLLYVALTRAKYRCYLVAGKVKDKTGKNKPETSPLSYLFHAPMDIRSEDALVSLVAREVKALSGPFMESQLQEIAAKGEGSITVTQMPEPGFGAVYVPAGDEGKPLAGRNFTSDIERDWRVASFTSFANRDAVTIELPDRDGTGVEETITELQTAGEEPKGMSIFTFPKGVQAGIFLHGIFEEIGFSDKDPLKVSELVARGLEKYGYDPGWQPHVCAMVSNVLAAPFSSPSGGFSLSGLRKGSWVTELEFFFPLRFISSGRLKLCLEKWRGEFAAADLLQVCSSLGFSPVRGMVRGFMDMVFEHDGKYYLVDWKSNHLGNRPGDYGPDKLARAMERHMYLLQYLLYTVALNRYLCLRVEGYEYDTHFGGVLYVFLRGVSPENGGETGVFRDKPPAAMIRELTDLLVECDVDGGSYDL